MATWRLRTGGSTARAVDQEAGAWSTGPRWTGEGAPAAAPWPLRPSSPRRLERARRAAQSARAGGARAGELRALCGRGGARPRRAGHAVARLRAGGETTASTFAQQRGGERERKASARSSPRCEARAGVLVVADSPTREIDGGAELHSTAAAMAARGSSTRGDGCCPRVPRGGAGL